ncbi:MAG: Gfo/Idh/MocA family oxidoreductase [Sedimentisphaerales bacterium]|nr:Gfo/Idh/MocA family oxidoreductase [Sedimentisphaerales bacterium]
MESITRRNFLKSSLGTTAALTILPTGAASAAADKVVLGIMGVGGRGRALLTSLVKKTDVYIKYICDADSRTYGPAVEIVVEGHGYKPKFVQDFRKMLEDPEVDAVVIATSDRWHALATIMACQAGKDVYVEKPLSLSIWDGRKMVEAARKYNRVVQVGTQSRSAPYTDKAAEYIRSGKLGDVYLARVFLMQESGPIDVADTQPVPEGLDYDLWCGPSPMLPYRPGVWFWRLWDFYVGYIMADLIHQVDLARYLIGREYPDTACNAGGVYQFDDGREQPDTQFATLEFGKLTMLLEGSLKAPYMHRIVHLPDQTKFPDWQHSATKVEICGTKGLMCFGRHGGGWQVFEGDSRTRQSNPVVSVPSGYKFGSIIDLHFDDFIDCIRTRKKPKADIEQAHLSMVLCHLANISYRLGNRKLKYDGTKERFSADEEANALLKPKYRKPWVVPEEV